MTMADATRIAKGSTYLVTQSIIDAAVRAVAFAFIARILTQTEMGVRVALSLTVAIAHLLTDIGFGSALSKYIAEYRGRNGDYSPFLFSGVLVKASTASFATILCAVAATQLSQLMLKSADYTVLFQLLSIYILFHCLNMTMSSLLLGLNKIREMAILNVVNIIVAQISAVVLLMFGHGLVGLVTGWILGQLAYFPISALIIAKGRHFTKHSIPEIAPFLRVLAKFSWPLFLTNIVVFVYGSFDQAILLAYLPLTEVGVYSVALLVFTVLSVVPGALSTTLFPYYSEQYGGDKHDSIMIGVRASTRYITLLYLPLAFGLMITANPVIALLAGTDYAKGDMILAVLCLFGGITGLSVAFGNLLFIYNMTKTILWINIASVGASMAMTLVLLPTFGLTGMAVVKGAAMVISFIFTIYALRRRMPIEFDKEALWKGFSAAMIMVLAVGLIEQMFFSGYLLPLYIIVGGIVYVIALRFLKAVNQNDILLIRNLAGKRAPSIVKVLEKVLT